jgi:hypothetical protein
MLEDVLLSLRAKDTVTLVGEAYKVQNVVSATDGSVLKARLLLVQLADPTICVNIEISTQVHRNLDVNLLQGV